MVKGGGGGVLEHETGWGRLPSVQHQLPVDRFRQEIQEILKGSAMITIIEAETGWTTRVPRFLLEEALETGRDCCIAVGVPRIAAARALADRVAEKAGEKVGNSVGLFTDEDKIRPTMRQSLSFATFGSLRHSAPSFLLHSCVG